MWTRWGGAWAPPESGLHQSRADYALQVKVTASPLLLCNTLDCLFWDVCNHQRVVAEALDAIQLGRLNQLAVDSLYPPKLDCIFFMVSLSFFCTFIFSSRRVLSAQDESVSDLQWPKSPWRFWLIFCFVAVHTGKKKAKALRLRCASLTHHTELPQLPPWLPNRKSLSWERPHTVKYSVLEFEGAFPCTHQHLFSLSLYLLTRVNLYSNSAWPHFFLFFPK